MNTEQRELIESIIKQNPSFAGNEHLLEQFCSEVYKKSYLLLDSVSNVDSLRNYLTKVVDTSISNVVKANIASNSASLKDFVEDVAPKEVVKSESVAQISKTPDEIVEEKIISINKKDNKLPEIKNPYEGLIDPLELISEKSVNPSLAKNIVNAIIKLDSKEPNKKFLDIFKLKYVQKLKQSEISKNLRISQNDLSKRFCEMVKLIRQEIL